MATKRGANTPNAASVKGFKHLSVAEVEAGLRKANGYITIAARIIGCDPSTIRRHVKQSPKLAALIDDLTDARLDTAELSLDAAIGRGEGWAVCFFLKTKGKGRGYVERVEFVDWRKELEQTGVKASELFEQMVSAIAEKIEPE